MLENNSESSKLTIQKLVSTLKSLEKRYNEVKTDRTSLLKFVEEIIPEAKLETKVGEIDADRLVASYKSVSTTKSQLASELKAAKDRLSGLEEENANLRALGSAMKLKVEECNRTIFKLETELKNRVNFEGDVLLSKIKSIGSPNQRPQPAESLEEKVRAQTEVIASLRAQLAVFQSAPKASHTLERREFQVQTDDLHFEKQKELNKHMGELRESLEALQREHNVRVLNP